MKYHIGDLFLVDGIEASVKYINSKGEAYLTPLEDEKDKSFILKGLVFSILDVRGIDKKTKKRAISINNTKCGAV